MTMYIIYLKSNTNTDKIEKPKNALLYFILQLDPDWRDISDVSKWVGKFVGISTTTTDIGFCGRCVGRCVEIISGIGSVFVVVGGGVADELPGSVAGEGSRAGMIVEEVCGDSF
mmetsp:Transcript_18644/g.38262  ORF Transcript_18644/g.38262 Transcript_18644/m.38262 type:complete len:114 (-) Transcript_18644:992-1333(-)